MVYCDSFRLVLHRGESVPIPVQSQPGTGNWTRRTASQFLEPWTGRSGPVELVISQFFILFFKCVKRIKFHHNHTSYLFEARKTTNSEFSCVQSYGLMFEFSCSITC